MKKVFLLLLTASTSFAVSAQTALPDAPNKGFENWTLSTTTTQQEPDDYASTEQILATFGLIGADDYVQRSTDKHSGTYAVKLENLENATFGAIPGIIISTDKPGAILEGDLSGYPYNSTTKPGSLKGFYKADISGGDTVKVAILVTKHDDDLGGRVILGGGEFAATTNQATYKEFEVMIEYNPEYADLSPDSVTVVAQSGGSPQDGGQATAGTTLSVDDLSYTALKPASIANKNNNANISVYPNPTVDVVKVKLANATEVKSVRVFDVVAKKAVEVTPSDIQNSEVQIPVSHLQQGMYIVSVLTDKGLMTKSFTKTK